LKRLDKKSLKFLCDIFFINPKIALIKMNQEYSVNKINKLNFKIFFRYFLSFLKNWLYVFILVIINIFISKKFKDKNFSIYISFPDEFIFLQNNQSKFQNFWLNGHLNIFNSCDKHIIISSNKLLKNDSNFYYYNSLTKFLIQNLSFFNKIKLINIHILYFFKFLFTIIKNKQFILLSRDLAHIAVYRSLSKTNININLFFNANMYTHNIISFSTMPALKTFFCYYSINNTPINYKLITKSNQISFNNYYKFLYIDNHLLWNYHHKNSLSKLSLIYGNKIITKPYIYYLDSFSPLIKNKTINIIIFDVQPYRDVSKSENYYNLDNCINFIDDILKSTKNIRNIKIYLKHKIRSHNTIKKFDTRYSKYLSSKSNNIVILDTNVNIFTIINKSSLCINFPYTSTASIAQSMNINSIYYDPSSSIVKQEYGIPILRGYDNLLNYMKINYSIK
jgi:polysaccharide biosynthesis PFTS motif protein